MFCLIYSTQDIFARYQRIIFNKNKLNKLNEYKTQSSDPG
jgi:hypothetical protein